MQRSRRNIHILLGALAAAGCGAVIEIKPRGQIRSVLRADRPWSPTAVAVGGKNVYVLEYLHTASDNRREWLPRVKKVSPDGKAVLLAAVKGR